MNRSVFVAPALLSMLALSLITDIAPAPGPHGTVVYPMSRVYRVYQSNPVYPSFQLAANAVAIDGSLSYYTWSELSRNIPQAVQANLPPGFDYSPWVPSGELASGGRTDPLSTEYPRTYAGLDQVSADWPKTTVTAGETINVSFIAVAPHNPSVWDVWMTTPDWEPDTPLRWSHMEFLGRPTVNFTGTHYEFNLTIPTDRSGHHALWVAWQRDDPVGEVFFSTSDLEILPENDECAGALTVTTGYNGTFDLAAATSSPETASCETGNGGDVWFRYTAECSGTLRVDTCATATNLDTVVSIWSGTCGALTEIGCDDNGCGARSVATAAVAQGTDYYIKVAMQAAATAGEFELGISFANGSGSHTTTTAGCGAPTLLAGGAPNIGGIVDYAVQGGTGSTQALVFGLVPISVTMCNGCVLGVQSIGTMSGSASFAIPCDAILVGTNWWIQGVDAFGTSGGCNLGGGVDFTLTDAIHTIVGN